MIELHPPSDGIMHAVAVRLAEKLARVGVLDVKVTYETFTEDGWDRHQGLVAIARTARHAWRAQHSLDYLKHPSPVDRARGSAEWIDMFTSVLASRLATTFEITATEVRGFPSVEGPRR